MRRSPSPRSRPRAWRAPSALLLILLAFGAGRAERLPVRVYTTADGLGSGAVNWVSRDSRGFLWFCTRDGLSRFDGQRFTTYRLAHASPDVAQIIERRRGDYLLLSQYGGLYRFDSRTPAAPAREAGDDSLTLDAELVAQSPRGELYEDREGRLWLAGFDAGLFTFDERDGRMTVRAVDLGLGGRPVNVAHLIESRDGSLWLSTSLGLIRRSGDGRTALYSTPPSTPIENFLSALYEDAAGRIWVGARGGLFVIKPRPPEDPAAFESAPLRGSPRSRAPVALPDSPGSVFEFTSADGLDSSLARGILQTADGRVWISSSKSLSVFDGREFHTFGTESELGVSLAGLAEDGDRNLWLASQNGAVKLVTRGLSTFGTEDGLGDKSIRAVYQTPTGDLYVVAGDWWVSRLEGRRFVTARPRLGVAGTPLWTSNAAMPDGAGSWWFASERRLFRFDGVPSPEALGRMRPSAVYETGPAFHDGAFYRVFEDSRGDVWVGTRSASPERSGLSLWLRATNSFRQFGPAENFPEGRAPSSFCEDAAGSLWVGFYGGGVARYRDGRFALFTPAEGLPEGFVTAMHLDGAGRLWLATNVGGLARVDDTGAERPAFVKFTTANGLSSNNVRAITEDDAGRIYLGTVRGIDRLSPDTGRVKHYTTADGLADDFITVAFRDREGALWFGTQGGLSRLAPEPDLPPREPPVLVGGLRISGVRQPLSELGEKSVGQLRLDYTQTNVEIDFFSLSYAPAERMRYQHKLEGADADWSAPAAERSVTYANLAPGTYRFLVRAVNADGLVSAEPASVSFRISPPVWARWWFGASVALLFGLVIYAAARARFQRKLELERVRTRIATDLHDDIGASLTRISLLSEVANRDEGRSHPAASRRLTQIAEDARTLVDSMSDIVWAIDPRRDDFLSVVERVRSFAADTLGAAGVSWQMTVAPNLPGRRLTPERRRALYLIFKEAVNNVVRHAGCRNASCHIAAEGHTLVATIEDDGRGLPPDGGNSGGNVKGKGDGSGRGGRGLVNMKARAAELGGSLEIGPREGGGTRLVLRLPLVPYGMNMFLRPGGARFKMRG